MFSSFNISASGLTAQRLRLDIISNNLANVETTQTASGGVLTGASWRSSGGPETKKPLVFIWVVR